VFIGNSYRSINNKIKEYFEINEILENKKVNMFYFTIDLYSDAILLDGYRRPTRILRLEDLNKELKKYGCYLNYVRCYTSHGFTSGWSTAWNLPKKVYLVTKKGSVFLFGVDSCTDDLINALEKIENNGVGEKREEGFGQVRVCDEFHLEVI